MRLMQTEQLFSSTESVGGKLFEAGNFKFCTANDNVSNHMHELQFASAISILQIYFLALYRSIQMTTQVMYVPTEGLCK